MDERRALTLFGWTIGAVVVLMFVLNALSLASLQKVPSASALQFPPAGVAVAHRPA